VRLKTNKQTNKIARPLHELVSGGKSTKKNKEKQALFKESLT
jgi:hypothetical protein